MANFGLFTQNGAYNAVDDRFSQAAFATRDADGKVAPGLLQAPTTDPLVSAAPTPNLTVTVRPFVAIVPDSGYGAYVGGIDAAITMAIVPELANNRYDILAWRHLEGINTDSTGASTLGSVTLAGQSSPISKQVKTGEVYWIQGTPSSSSSPAVPAVPAGSVALARVYVAGGTSTITPANITLLGRFVAANGGIVNSPAAVAGEATALPSGALVMSSGILLRSNGATLDRVPVAVAEAYGSIGGTFNVAAGRATSTPTVLTIRQSAGTGLRVEGFSEFVLAGTNLVIGAADVQYSVSGAWTTCTEARDSVGSQASGTPTTVRSIGYVPPPELDRTIGIRLTLRSLSGQPSTWTGATVHAHPVSRTTQL